jgi:non-specific serine/threonine protein kinase
MIGQTISHHRITAKLGEGGMGEVYLATDTNLDRQVALKFLPESLQKDPEARERLIREAKAASQLNHTNILTIHSVEQTDGRDFIVMEYVAGNALTEYVRTKNLALDAILDLALQIAAGLDKAHRAGVVHRDLKPSNILVDREGHLKILDFGLAKLRGAAKLTQTGSTQGTAAYMSPEQAQAKEADHRSDLFSLGVVLYEMIARRLPFSGEHEAAIAYAIMHEHPEPLKRYKADVPDELQRIVGKCLAKRPAERYQSAADLAADLRALQSARQESSGIVPARTSKRRSVIVALVSVVVVAICATMIAFVAPRFIKGPNSKSLAGRKMLAVLPFENLGSPDQEYFADGITDEITGKLASIRDLGVISRTSTMQYKKTTKNLRVVAKELGVDYVLEGTILWDKSRDVSRVRILPQLIRVSDDTHLWAETYQRPLIDIFEVQADIASRIAEAMNIALRGTEVATLSEMPTRNLEAYQAYLRGMDHMQSPNSREDWQLAVQMFQRAVQLDSTFALAYARLAFAHAGMHFYGFDATQERLIQSKAAADRALALQPDLPWAHIAFGYYYYWGQRDYDRALQEIALAEVDLPGDPEILEAKAYIWRRQGKLRAAVEQLELAFLLNPLNADLADEIGGTYCYLREYVSAEQFLDRSISLAPDNFNAYWSKAWNYYSWRGDTSLARATVASIPKQDDDNTRIAWFWLHVYERDYPAALDELELVSIGPGGGQDRFSPKAQLAGTVFELINQRDRARACFDSARVVLEKELSARPYDHRVHSSLGIVYAGLGRKDDAIREGKLGVELLTVSKDALGGVFRVEDLALIYVMVGEYDAALDQIEYLLSIPSLVSVSLLRLDPRYDPLRNLPRFQKLLQQPDKVF